MTDCGVGGLEAIDKLVQYIRIRAYISYLHAKRLDSHFEMTPYDCSETYNIFQPDNIFHL